MATSTIKKTEIRIVEIPYSNFSWDNDSKSFIYSNPNIPLNNLFGFIVRPTNGAAMLQAFMNYNKMELKVFGYIPSIGSQINSDYVFEIYAIGN